MLDVKRLVLEDTDATMDLKGLVRRVSTRAVGDIRLGCIERWCCCCEEGNEVDDDSDDGSLLLSSLLLISVQLEEEA